MNPKIFELTKKVLENETNEWRYKKAEIQQEINRLETKKKDLNDKVFKANTEYVFTAKDAEFSLWVAKKTVQINQEIHFLHQKLATIEVSLLEAIREEKKIEILANEAQQERKKKKELGIENYNDFVSMTKYIASLKKII